MEPVLNNLPLLLDGLWTTVRLTVLAGIIALVLGVIVALLRVNPLRPLRSLGTAYVEFIRNVPLLAHLFFWVYGLPFIGILLPEFVAAFCGLGVYTAAFVAEAIRAGIEGVGRGQTEAARALALPYSTMMRLIVL
jgi:His/Glu/Gln/Arg/opine family amino acid ABC transporter permease subunit